MISRPYTETIFSVGAVFYGQTADLGRDAAAGCRGGGGHRQRTVRSCAAGGGGCVPGLSGYASSGAGGGGGPFARRTVPGGNGAEQHTYRCSLWSDENGALTGSALEQTTEVLRGSYDFDWDGASETVEVVTVLDPEAGAPPAWYELRVTDGGEALWSATAGLSHAGRRSFFACTVDGADCLLTYDPAMYQGGAGYAYELFSLEGGGLTLLRQGSVQFDVNFGSPSHDSFDADTIAAFLEEVHGYLDTATLLLSTEGGVYASGGSGADFRGDDLSGTLYDTPGTWYQRVRAAEAALTD